ncbi:hypothetical protein [uncultured Vagococcus sp.]|uniref:hypothetical protein n=1 Tax=uncultured Vagococcus sp. TaxID=189676 RepID=UPI0028D8D54F|nr:hypothetical protein [uncultured Vagococcus sp.]
MIIWEGTDVVCCYNVAAQMELKRIRFVHLPKKPDPEKVVAFANLLLEVLPKSHSKDSSVIITRTRYV